MSKNCIDKYIEEVIPSKTVRDFIKQNEHHFTLNEQVALICFSEQKIDTKINKLTEILIDKQLDTTKEPIGFMAETSELIALYSMILDIAEGNRSDKYVLMVSNMNDDSDDNKMVTKSVKHIVNIIQNNETLKINREVDIVNIETAEIVGSIKLNSDMIPVDFSLTDKFECETPKIKNTFVDFPNIFEAGDKVKIHGDFTDTVYVVCYDNEVSDEFKENCDIFDSCVTVIPEYTLDTNKDYKVQINDIIQNRIQYVDTDKVEPDIIDDYHDHFYTAFVEKV